MRPSPSEPFTQFTTIATFACLGLLAAANAGCSKSPSGPSGTITVTGNGTTSLTYTKDIQPVLASDCVSCHGPSQKQAGVDLSSFAGVSKVLVAGNQNSTLVLVTQPSGLMYGELTGNRTTKAGLFYDWVVNSKAAQ